MKIGRLPLAGMLDKTPSSSQFRELVSSSRSYGLTEGGTHADEFSPTELGADVAGGDEVARDRALKAAVLNVAPYWQFFETYKGKKVPSKAAFEEFLTKSVGIPESRVAECRANILADAETAGFVTEMKGGKWINFEASPILPDDAGEDENDQEEEGGDESQLPAPDQRIDAPDDPGNDVQSRTSKRAAGHREGGRKVFIAHGKNREPLEQLKKVLDQFKVEYAVAVDEPNVGRPISKKVAELMEDECSSGIFIFTADEKFLRETDKGETEEVWRPSENLVYELGAASILYENRIVIFKEKDVNFPSDFSDLGHIEFEKDQLVAEMGLLFSELVGLDILEVRAKG